MEYVGVTMRSEDGRGVLRVCMLILEVDPVTSLAGVVDLLDTDAVGGFPALEAGAYRGLIEVQPTMDVTPDFHNAWAYGPAWGECERVGGGTIRDQRRASGMRDPQAPEAPFSGLPSAALESALP